MIDAVKPRRARRPKPAPYDPYVPRTETAAGWERTTWSERPHPTNPSGSDSVHRRTTTQLGRGYVCVHEETRARGEPRHEVTVLQDGVLIGRRWPTDTEVRGHAGAEGVAKAILREAGVDLTGVQTIGRWMLEPGRR